MAPTSILTLKNDNGCCEQVSAAPWMIETSGPSVEISDGKETST
jgi:hypothetical protein